MSINRLIKSGFPVTDADVAVIGGGPAGLAAAIEARDSGARVVLIERDHELGGILQQCIHNGFGLHYFGEELTGPEYAARFIEKCGGIEIMLDTMALEISPLGVIAVSHKGIRIIKAGAIVLAMGCRERTRGALNVPGDRPAGIYTAGWAQRLVNMEGYMPGTRVVVLGSGDIGLIMARRMTYEGAKVEAVCEIMPYSSGLNRNIVQCLHDYDIPLYLNHTVTHVTGHDRLESVTIARVDENRLPITGSERVIPCDTLLLSVGLIPENELTNEAGAEMDGITGGAVVDQSRQTSLEGVFACGNVLHVHDLVDHVSREAQIAGRAAASHALRGKTGGKTMEYRVKCGDGVRYVVPQKLTLPAVDTKCTLYYRVASVAHNAVVEASCGGETIARVKKLIVTPGEMEYIEIDLSKVEGDVELALSSPEEAVK